MPTKQKPTRKKKATKKKAPSRKARRPSVPKEWPASNVEARYTKDLIPYARNARTHTNAQVKKIAASIKEWDWTNPILIDEEDTIIAGHGRVLAAELLELEAVPVMVARGWSKPQIRAYVIADNQLALEAGWDPDMLTLELQELQTDGFDLELIGFGEKELQGLLFKDADDALAGANPELPELQKVVVSQVGDVWILGGHRLMCGDSTRADDVARLTDGAAAECIVADPPYGMGKEAEGVLNDNTYGDKLDAFQMEWLAAFKPHLLENGSMYIWGNPADLWRLWYTGGLQLDGEFMVRNELVWNKQNAFGMNSAGQHSYSVSTERCLFLMRGQQFLGNQNKEDYWDGWDPLRLWLVGERKKAGWKVSRVNEITNTSMAGHWFGKSQFQPISEGNYQLLQAAADGVAFVEDYPDLFARLFPDAKEGGNQHRREISAALRESRTWFDNTHDKMHEVWEYSRVLGDDRFGHATPKPVAMLGRCIKSSSPEAGTVLDPFSGTGTVLIACELLGRSCRAMELEPAYVDVAVRRWQEQTGQAAKLEGTKSTFEAIEAKRK